MKTALIFQAGEPLLVTAEEVKSGKYSKDEYEFVDPEYEFKVQFVRGAKNNGGPYFRLYYSYEDYKRLFPERADRYQIVADMRRYQESVWHRNWKDQLSPFCEIEKTIKNPHTKKYKFADAFYSDSNTVIEIQHSYIALDFEERNKFYADMGMNTVWLYDLSRANVVKTENGVVEILENNANGFFRISENPENLLNHNVFIQTKSKLIYRVKELLRHTVKSELKSTIRYFIPAPTYTEEEFIQAIKNNAFFNYQQYSKAITSANDDKGLGGKSIPELWNKQYSNMIVKDLTNGQRILVIGDKSGNIVRNYNDCILYYFVDRLWNGYDKTSSIKFPLSHCDESAQKWKYISSR